ncbi:hypothetical protein GGR52DRAFT_8853 [Hypoxylon sp. FL1284]|nr:hypothetical protein GGR52DRAFT_8853 [Hypoxylon sp. FL1284]
MMLDPPSKGRGEVDRNSRNSRDPMLPSTLITRYATSTIGNSYRYATQPSSLTLGPRHMSNQDPYLAASRPANSSEVYGLALGSCFLIVLLSWLLIIGIRVGNGALRRKNKKKSDADPESGTRLDPLPSKRRRPRLPGMGTAATGELIRSARRKSIKIVAGLRRDMVSIRKASPPPMDEEAAVGGCVEGLGTTKADDPFLHHRRQATGVLSV